MKQDSSRVILVTKAVKQYNDSFYKRKALNSVIRNTVQKEKCAICSETRFLDYCHVIPNSILTKNTDLKYLESAPENFYILCKNHHWGFDHKQLNSDELESLYLNSKIETIELIFDLVNREYRIIDEEFTKKVDDFVSWINWVANHFFVKNN